MLTPVLIRLEYSEAGIFEDRATQMVLNRDFPVPDFRVINCDGILRITTERLSLEYDTSLPFYESSLIIKLLGNLSPYSNVWRFGQKSRDLGGTARSLDAADGEIPLEQGLLSRDGFSVIDDSNSLVISDNGWI